MLPLIDTHQHLWDFDRFHLPWLDGAGPPLGRSHRPEDYAKETHGLNVVATVYMEVDVEAGQQLAEAEYVAALCADPANPMAAAVVGGRPAEPNFADYLDQVTEAGRGYVRGVRQVLHGGTPAGFCLGDDFVRGVQLLGERGLSFDLCMKPDELADGAELARRCPDTRFVLDHCGNGPIAGSDADRSLWRRGMEAIAAQPNVVACKVSGIVAQAGGPNKWTPADLAPVVHFTCDAFGPERAMFGGDWPVCTVAARLRDWVEALQTLVAGWNETNQRRLFADNARRIYNLR